MKQQNKKTFFFFSHAEFATLWRLIAARLAYNATRGQEPNYDAQKEASCDLSLRRMKLFSIIAQHRAKQISALKDIGSNDRNKLIRTSHTRSITISSREHGNIRRNATPRKLT